MYIIQQDDKDPNYEREWEYFDKLHHQKYRDKNQNRVDHSFTLAKNLLGDDELQRIIYEFRFLPAGRIQAALGATEREVSPFNCSVSQVVTDDIPGIYAALTNAAIILRLGTGIGFNFSHLRPQGALVKKLQSEASGPISFMKLFHESAALISSAGHRRGAQMAIMNISHPDIKQFIDAKMIKGLETFNISVGISDAFMYAVRQDTGWPLIFDGEVYGNVPARYLWEKIIKNAFNSAEPGVVFLDTMNKMNNLWYCEHIEATNPCSEQPLPPYGLCTLGSFNLVKYIIHNNSERKWKFNIELFKSDVHKVVEAYDNIFDNAIYAIPEHQVEALNKRRIGLGLTGIANAIEMIVGRPCYGDEDFNFHLTEIASILVCTAYESSVKLAQKRGPFPLFNVTDYMNGAFISTLPWELQDKIEENGIRNSHLISYAPCGTISQIAGNISSGVEPVFYHEVSRKVFLKEGEIKINLRDYAFREHDFKGRTLEECTVDQHLEVARICQKHCDSAISKTINTTPGCTFEEYKDVYMKAYEMGLKGCTVYRPSKEMQDLRGVVIEKAEEAVNTSELYTANCASGVCER